jgi:hypothetical protein
MPTGVDLSAQYFGEVFLTDEPKRNLPLSCTPFHVRGEARITGRPRLSHD